MTETARLEKGQTAPDFTLPDQDGAPVTLSDLRGQDVIVYFYPAAGTPGCTKQACDFRDSMGSLQAAGYRVLGVSKDPQEDLARFREEQGLGFTLLSDPEHATAEAYGVWAEKSMYGKKYLGIVRSAFLVDEKGKVEAAWPKVSPKDTPKNLLKALAPEA